jgi:hypothetical protein
VNIRITLFLLLIVVGFSACDKEAVSKIPNISLASINPSDPPIVRAFVDSVFITFRFTDGDADIARTPSDTMSAIYIKDSRNDSTGFEKISFPSIDVAIEDPKKGIQGTCTFWLDNLAPRSDSIHTRFGDTLFYIFYITDRAGNRSDTIVTPQIIVRF